MRRLYHRERNRRYHLSLKELNQVYSEQKGDDLVHELNQYSRRKLSKDEKKMRAFFFKLSQVVKEPYNNSKRCHRQFLSALRQLLNLTFSFTPTKSWHHRLYTLLLDLCETKFYRIHFYLFGHQLLQDIFSNLGSIHDPNETSFNFEKHFSEYNLLDESLFINKSQPMILLERDLRKLNDMFVKTKFDPHKYNHPFLLYRLSIFRDGEISLVKMVRMGSATYESWMHKAKIIPEFKGFLFKLKQNGKQHLYVNKQATWGEEGERSTAIIALEQQFDNFYCVCLPSDGNFYFQDKQYQKIDEAKAFKQIFYHLLLGEKEKGYYHLPKKWSQSDEFQKQLRALLDEVHQTFFDQKIKLSSFERRLFIDHLYTLLIIYFLKTYSLHSINITCRDGIDRAGIEQAKLLYYFQVSLGIEEELESKKEKQFLIHFPPYLAKSRPMISERCEYLHQYLSSYSAQNKYNIRCLQNENPILYSRPHFVKSM